MLWVLELIYRCGGNKSILCGAFSGFSPLSPLYFPLFISVTGAYFSHGRRGSWLGCQFLPAMSSHAHLGAGPPVVETPGCVRHPTST